ncbi:unnamed protein product [Schistosoma intercalatum]|nr:unnamed protein product [Schistosoma intercalatum]
MTHQISLSALRQQWKVTGPSRPALPIDSRKQSQLPLYESYISDILNLYTSRPDRITPVEFNQCQVIDSYLQMKA